MFYSLDKDLNNQIALTFAKSCLCDNHNVCDNCPACAQFDSNSHNDLMIINQPSIKVEDVNIILSKLATKPISSEYKVFVLLDAENINEIAQNKLLKSLEEPNPCVKFILTCTKTDKILPTILSRVNKIFVPNLNQQDKQILSEELGLNSELKSKFINSNYTLTDIINMSSNDNYSNTISSIKYLLFNLKTSQDIPHVASNLSNFDKSIFFNLLQEIFLSALKNDMTKYDKELVAFVKLNYSEKAIIRIIKLIEDAYKKQTSNVQLSYIIDNLLFNILKEKFLCK